MISRASAHRRRRLLSSFSGGFSGLITVERKSKTAASLGSGRSSLNCDNFYLPVLLPWMLTVMLCVLLPSLLSSTALFLSAVALIVCWPFVNRMVFDFGRLRAEK